MLADMAGCLAVRMALGAPASRTSSEIIVRCQTHLAVPVVRERAGRGRRPPTALIHQHPAFLSPSFIPACWGMSFNSSRRRWTCGETPGRGGRRPGGGQRGGEAGGWPQPARACGSSRPVPSSAEGLRSLRELGAGPGPAGAWI